MAKSYLIKVANTSDRVDANTVKYWVDSYSLVSYRGESSVYKVIIGGTQLLVVDPDRVNWDVVEIDDNSILKRGDYPYFKMDKYVYKGSDKALELKASYIDNEYVGYNTAVHIQDATAYNSDSGSIINAALKVDGGGYFGKNLKVRERLVVGDDITPSKFVDIDSAAEDSTSKAFVTISNPGAEAVVDANYSLMGKGAAHIDGGLAVSRNIVSLGSGFIAGNLNVKGGINASRLAGVVALSECSKSLIAYNTGSIYSIGVNVSAVQQEMDAAPFTYTSLEREYHPPPPEAGSCVTGSWSWKTVTKTGSITYIAAKFKGFGTYEGEIIVNTPDGKSICTAQLQNVTLVSQKTGTLYTSRCEVKSGKTIKVAFEVFNSSSDVAYTQVIQFGIRYTLSN